jgi:hypothetical protein
VCTIARPRCHTATGEAPTTVAWVTRYTVPEPGRVWAALSAARQEDGLVPFLLGNLAGDPTWHWDTEEFDQPADPGELDHIDATEVLAEMWDGEMPSDEEEEAEGEEWAEECAEIRAQFAKQFPGLAPPEDTPLSPERLDEVLGSLPAARIGLVPASWPADVLPLVGWTPSDQSDALPIAAVVRSWEDRFGARLLRVGFAEVSLLIDWQPPHFVRPRRLRPRLRRSRVQCLAQRRARSARLMGRYRACAADRRAVRLMRRPKPVKLAACPRLREIVEGKPGAALLVPSMAALAAALDSPSRPVLPCSPARAPR